MTLFLNNMKYWFKQKTYGYGWVPVRWQGWLMTLLFVGMIILSAYTNNFFSDEPTFEQVARYFFDIIILTALFMLIFKGKAKGKMKWRWGNTADDSLEDDF